MAKKKSAAKKATKKSREKQPLLNDDDAFKPIAEIERECDSYFAASADLSDAHSEMEDAKKKMAEMLKKHELPYYTYKGHTINLNHVVKDKVTIKKNRAASASTAA